MFVFADCSLSPRLSMTVLSRDFVRSRARHLHYKEVPSYDDRVLSFVHHRKAGCGDKKHKVQCLFLTDFPWHFVLVRISESWCRLRGRRSDDHPIPWKIRPHPTGQDGRQSQPSWDDPEKPSNPHRHWLSCGNTGNVPSVSFVSCFCKSYFWRMNRRTGEQQKNKSNSNGNMIF